MQITRHNANQVMTHLCLTGFLMPKIKNKLLKEVPEKTVDVFTCAIGLPHPCNNLTPSKKAALILSLP